MASDTDAVEKIRYDRLNLVCRKALEQSIKKCLSTEQINRCFPTIASTDEGVKTLKIARSQVIDFWHSNSLKEFELIFNERDIKQKLDDLDEIIYRAQQRKKTHSEPAVEIDLLSSSELMDSALSSRTHESLSNLKMIYNQLRIDNQELYSELKEVADESETTKDSIEEMLGSLDKEAWTINEEGDKIDLNELVKIYSEKIV